LGEKLEHLREKYAKTTIQLDLMTTESMEEKRALMVERNELQSRYDRMVETMQNNEQEYNATKFTTQTLTSNLNVKENVIIELKKKIQNETETWNTTQTELEQQNVHMSTAIGELETRLYAATDEIRNTTLTINTKQTGTLKKCVFFKF
jgi:chromosome segregation ATPase